METAFPNIIMDAFIMLAFDIPPIAQPPVGLITGENIRIQHGTWPALDIGMTSYRVIGITPSSWLMVDGPGWLQFHGNVSAVAAACNAMQLRLLTNRAAYLTALDRYQNRSKRCSIGGLLEIDMGRGQWAIRTSDIAAVDVREAFLEATSGACLASGVDPDESDTLATDGTDHVDANFWWRFAWRSKTSPQP